MYVHADPLCCIVCANATRWKPRHIDTITFRAIEQLYTPRQLMYYWNDMDLPW